MWVEPEWVPVTVAARKLGIAVSTLRRWIFAKRVVAQRFPDASGRLYVRADWLAAPSIGSEPPAKNARRRKTTMQALHDAAVEELRRAGIA